jgi:hypothetical protein
MSSGYDQSMAQGTTGAQQPTSTSTMGSWFQNNKTTIIIVVVLIIVAVGGWYWWSHRSTSTGTGAEMSPTSTDGAAMAPMAPKGGNGITVTRMRGSYY